MGTDRYQWLGQFSRPSLWRLTGDTPSYVGHVEQRGLWWLAVLPHGRKSQYATMPEATDELCRAVGVKPLPSGLTEDDDGGKAWVDGWIGGGE